MKRIHNQQKIIIIAAAILVLFLQAAEAQVMPVVCKLRGTLGTAPARGTTGALPNRIRRAGTPTTCSSTAVPTPFNDASGSYLYNTHTLTNPSVFPICLPVRLTKTNPSVSGADLHLAVFQHPFTSVDITNTGRFRGDSGGSTGAFSLHQPTTFNVVIPGNSSVSLLVYNTVNTSTGAEPYEIDFCTTTTAFNGALAIPDNNSTGVNANLPVTASGRVTDVNFRFTTGPNACNATAGNTNAAVDHTFVGDLNFRLTAPGGFPSAAFWERRGGTRENICSTLIDDEGSYSALSTITSQTGQFVSGRFSPEDNQRLSRFDGQNAQGTWVLNVSDNANDDVGSLRRFALEITTAPLKKAFDYDGDGRADLSIYRQSVGEWWYNRSSDLSTFATQFGGTSDRIVPRDYSGDGLTDIAIWRPATGEWFILRSEDYSYYAFPFGTTGDLPAPADYDGDTFDDPAVFRPSTGVWYISLSTGGFMINTFGEHGDMPVVADYDGDGKADQMVFRRNGGNPSVWYVRYSRNGSFAQFPFGESSDMPVAGDYTGDGRADIAVWRPSNGTWYIAPLGAAPYQIPFGADGDRPAPADYDGDGKYDPTVFRPSGGLWYSARSNGGIAIQQFGLPGDRATQTSAVQQYIAGW